MPDLDRSCIRLEQSQPETKPPSRTGPPPPAATSAHVESAASGSKRSQRSCRGHSLSAGADTRSDADRSDDRCGQGEHGSVVVAAEPSRRNAMPSKPLEPGDPVRLGRLSSGTARLSGQGIVYLGRGTAPGEGVAVRCSVDRRRQRPGSGWPASLTPFTGSAARHECDRGIGGGRPALRREQFIDGPSLQERVDEQGPLSEGDRSACGRNHRADRDPRCGGGASRLPEANVLLGPDGPASSTSARPAHRRPRSRAGSSAPVLRGTRAAGTSARPAPSTYSPGRWR